MTEELLTNTKYNLYVTDVEAPHGSQLCSGNKLLDWSVGIYMQNACGPCILPHCRTITARQNGLCQIWVVLLPVGSVRGFSYLEDGAPI